MKTKIEGKKKKIFGCREHIKKRVFKSFVAQWHCLFSFKKLNNSSNSPSPYVTIELSKRERERERESLLGKFENGAAKMSRWGV